MIHVKLIKLQDNEQNYFHFFFDASVSLTVIINYYYYFHSFIILDQFEMLRHL